MSATYDDGRLVTSCEICGSAKSPFGVGVSLRKGEVGKWYCREHWPDRERFKFTRRDGWIEMESVSNTRG